MMRSINSLNRDFSIARITFSDVKYKTDNWKIFEELILSNEKMYPEIGGWLKNKVVPGLSKDERMALVGYHHNLPVVSAVLKRKEKTKFCHLHINENYRNMSLGDLFFTLMILESRNSAREIHFSLPESLWQKKKEFFKTFGFTKAIESPSQYRSFERELKCSAPFYKVWSTALEKFPRLAATFSLEDYAVNDETLIMSITPGRINKIVSGEFKVEIRKKFSSKWVGRQVSIYSSVPFRGIVGKTQIKNVVEAAPERIWEEFGAETGLNRNQFFYYVGNAKKISAIILNCPQFFDHKTSFEMTKRLYNRQDLLLEKGKNWSKAVPISTFMQSIVG